MLASAKCTGFAKLPACIWLTSFLPAANTAYAALHFMLLVSPAVADDCHSPRMCNAQAIHISPDVQNALRAGRPVVALESTIISHGLPWPQNLEMAQDVEGIIRAHGATPATIAVMQGTPCVGLTHDQMTQLASR